MNMVLQVQKSPTVALLWLYCGPTVAKRAAFAVMIINQPAAPKKHGRPAHSAALEGHVA